MLPLSHATTSASRFPPANDAIAHTVVSSTLLSAGNSARVLENLSVADPAVANPDIPPPVLVRPPLATFLPDFISQADLDERWEDFKTHLKTQPLTEKEARAFVSSGVLQTKAGEAVADLIEAAMLRSVRPKGALTQARLAEIVKVICHLPPDKWAASLGENLGFVDGKTDLGLKGLLHSQMEQSRTVRDEKIANAELLSDPHLNRLNELAKEGRSYIRSSDGELNAALQILADAKDLRPTPKSACAELTAFIDFLERKDVARVRWPDHYVERVKALRDEIRPDDDTRAGWLDVLTATSWLEWAFGRTDSSSMATQTANPAPSNEDVPALLATLQAFERSGDFYTHVTDNGPKIPVSIMGKLLYAANVVNMLGLDLDDSHIKKGPGPAPAREPLNAGDAWRNGVADLSRSPLEPPMDPLAMLGQAAAQVDRIFERLASNLVPWDSAYANDAFELRDMLEDVREQVYQSPTVDLGPQADYPVQIAATAAAVLTLYMAVSNFAATWFLPEPEQWVDPLQGVELTPDVEPDEDAVIEDYIVEAFAEVLELHPDFAREVKRLVSACEYDDPADDLQLVEDLETLMQQPMPDRENLTYEQYLHTWDELAMWEARDEFEVDPVNETTTEPATSEATDTQAKVRSRRSVGLDAMVFSNMQTSESGLAAHSLIRAGQRLQDADNAIPPNEEIAPGVTITQAADLFIEDFVNLQKVLNPSLFIVDVIEGLVTHSDIPDVLKHKVNYRTLFRVEYDLPPPNGKHGGFYKTTTRHKMFTLAELLMQRPQREAQSRENVRIVWPVLYTPEFRSAVEGTDVWANYKERSEKVLSQPKIHELWKENFKFKLKQVVGDSLTAGKLSEQGRDIADSFLKGDIRIRPVSIKQGRYADFTRVSNAVFLTRGRGPEGLFVFLGGNETVIESPLELFKEQGKSIEEFPALRDELSKRIPLRDFFARDEDDFKYSQGKFEWDWNPLHMFESYKWSYKPIAFGRREGPTHYGEYHDAYKEMFENVVSKARADMDTMTSTWSERAIDKFMEILVDGLTGAAIILALPGAPTAGAAFRMGARASAAQYVRGKLHDDPMEGSRHQANAIKGMIAQVAGHYIGEVLGKVVSKVTAARIARKVGDRLKAAGVFPDDISRHLPKYGHSPSPVATSAKRIAKPIPPIVRSEWVIQEKVTKKLTGPAVVERLKALNKGPDVAQRLMERSRVIYFGGPQQGYVYQGFAMHGDMRAPQEIFKSGLKSNGGLKASGYYDQAGMGAFYEGGKQGGWTYLINGSGIKGEDLVRTANWRAGAANLGANPSRIRYAQDISPENILGAYDSTGKFWPNTEALSSAIAKLASKADELPVPIKKLVQDGTPVQTPIEIQNPYEEGGLTN